MKHTSILALTAILVASAACGELESDSGKPGPEDEFCTLENHCFVTESGSVQCLDGYEWEQPDVPGNFNCVPLGNGDDEEVCGNGRCLYPENQSNCAEDCGVCGNGRCEPAEKHSSCPGDCPLICDWDEKKCPGDFCIPKSGDCCDNTRVWCSDGECRWNDEMGEYRCYCPDGEKWCDGSCIPSAADCCGDGSGGLYCNNGQCVPDSSADLGYSCQEPRGVCLYRESYTTSCGSNEGPEWKCVAGNWTLEDCRDDHDDDGFCSYGCCYRWYTSGHEVFDGTCSEALASKS